MSTVVVTDPGGKTSSEQYDLVHGSRRINSTDALGNTTSYGYDTSGFINTVTDPNGNVTLTGHDVRGNTVSQTLCQNQPNRGSLGTPSWDARQITPERRWYGFFGFFGGRPTRQP